MTQQHSTAIAIIIGFGLVAGAIFASDDVVSKTLQPQEYTTESDPTNQPSVVNPKRAKDRHVFGDPEAPITIVEFSDVECPFCARLHPTLEQIVLQSSGEVQWEYRHLPLPTHRNAELGAIASECVSELAGGDDFWTYLDVLFENIRDHSEDFYVAEALALGVDESAFQSCLEDPDIARQVAADAVTAQQLGGRGTPFSIIEFPSGETRPVSGALPFEQWQAILNQN